MTSDTADRGNESPNTPAAGTKGRLFDSAFYQAWALDENGAWLYLPADATPDSPAGTTGGSWRERVRSAALKCPAPGCGAVYTGIRKGAGRLAFVHPKTGSTHTDKQSKETLWRLAAQQMLAQWALGTHPGSSVQTGTGEQAATPDVLITLADGSRIALECRYAAFGTAEWRQRHDEHQQQGVTDVWLLANTGPQSRKATGAPERLRPQAAVAELITAGVPTFWLNPFLGLVGTPVPADGAATVALAEGPIGDWSGPVGAAAAAPGSTTVAGSAVTAEPAVAAGSAVTAESAEVTQTEVPVTGSLPAAEPENTVLATDPAPESAGTDSAGATGSAAPAEPTDAPGPAAVTEVAEPAEPAEPSERSAERAGRAERGDVGGGNQIDGLRR